MDERWWHPLGWKEGKRQPRYAKLRTRNNRTSLFNGHQLSLNDGACFGELINALGEKGPELRSRDFADSPDIQPPQPQTTDFEKEFHSETETKYSEMLPPSKKSFKAISKAWFAPGGKLRPFRLLRRKRYISDWTTFNQLVFASAVYVFFTNILPGITFASDLYVLTGMTWGTIEVVFSTGLCGVIFSLWVWIAEYQGHD
jgi:hypothetical protein